jgi:hypothetical protein
MAEEWGIRALHLSGYLLASGLPMAFIPIQYVFSWKNRNKRVVQF